MGIANTKLPVSKMDMIQNFMGDLDEEDLAEITDCIEGYIQFNELDKFQQDIMTLYRSLP